MVITKSIKTRISTVFLREDGILQIDINSDCEFATLDFNELVEAAKTIGNGKKFLNLIMVGKNTLADHESRVASCSQEGSIYKLADAFVIDSLPQKIIANFYMRVNKPYVPTKFFNNEEDAVKWLMEQGIKN
jgi:hypothetical protein